MQSSNYKSLSSLNAWVDNYNSSDISAIATSIRRFGMNNALRVWGNTVMAGNHTFMALQKIKAEGPDLTLDLSYPPANVLAEGDEWQVQCVDVSHLDEIKVKAFAIADNELARQSVVDQEKLASYLREIAEHDEALVHDVGVPEDDLDRYLGELLPPSDPIPTNTLHERFVVPPFSVLDARQGYWSERKQAWIDLGIKSDDGREELLTFSKSSQPPEIYNLRNRMRARLKRDPEWPEILAEAKKRGIKTQTGTSIFDPVVCEIVYRWFCPPDGRILDPFAGGSVRGIVAAYLGRQYTGIDLRGEQVAANIAQAQALNVDPQPEWITGDSAHLDTLSSGLYDLVFTCPPYADLERYSDDPNDLSTMEYHEFLAVYRQIIHLACQQLRQDRFAGIVVGDIRDKKGLYRNFVSDTIAAFQDAGLELYNEAILVTQAASLAIRAGKQFTASRKLGKQHQNVLIFVKGQPDAAVAACGTVDVTMPDDGEEDFWDPAA